jgi:hypothetical protein
VAASGKPAVPAGQAAAAPFTRKQRRAARSARDQSASRRTWRGGHNAVRADAARRARIWAIASARRDREIVSSARLILVISKRVSDLSADPPDACSRAAGQLTRRAARLLQSPLSGTVAGGHALAAGIAQERHSGRRCRIGDNGEAAAAGDKSAAIVPKEASPDLRVGVSRLLLRGEGTVRQGPFRTAPRRPTRHCARVGRNCGSCLESAAPQRAVTAHDVRSALVPGRSSSGQQQVGALRQSAPGQTAPRSAVDGG